MKFLYVCLTLCMSLLMQSCSESIESSPLEWPQITEQNKPWTRWWWMGSAVDEANLTRSMELYDEIGLGGVEITPIYGVKGHEDQFVEYLSPQWTNLFIFTLQEADRIGLGVDIATGTGWPFGGPSVEADDASQYVAYKTYEVLAGQGVPEGISYTQDSYVRGVSAQPDMSQLVEPIRDNDDLQALAIDQIQFSKQLPLQVLMGYSDSGEILDLTGYVGADGQLDWVAPDGRWVLYAVFQGGHGKMVERAAPGGEGYAIDHFSEAAINNYLNVFDEAFSGHDIGTLRGFFNDSYEVDDARGEANWTSAFFEDFEARRGYDIRAHLPALFGNDTDEKNQRVLTDYRHTISELLLDKFTEPWTKWANSKGAITRNQAHGSPANILDLYAAADIPESESTDLMRIKAASSAANVAGKQLASAEAATWLNEHFHSNWSDVKEALDQFFLGGINHIVYHGTAYSPEGASWPGWLFYAAVHFSPQNPLWDDFGTLNEYVTRTQSILQRGRPANDVLLYFPVSDRFAERGSSMLVHFHGIEPFEGMMIEEDADNLHEQGYAFDFVSDRQIQAAASGESYIESGGNEYKTVVVPGARLMPLATLEKLVALAEAGATVIFHGQLPESIPGMSNLENQMAAFEQTLSRIQFTPSAVAGMESARIGEGQFLVGADLGQMLQEAGVQREALVDDGLEYIRRKRPGGVDYFLVNRGENAFDAWMPINAKGRSVAVFDPMTGDIGQATFRGGENNMEVYLQVAAGEALILGVFDEEVEGEQFAFYRPTGDIRSLDGPWTVEFINGGPEMPETTTIDQLVSWTEFAGSEGKSFAGTARYTTTFSVEEGEAEAWLMHLGAVHETARVHINGELLGTLIGPNYSLTLPASSLQPENIVEVEVSSLMANRISEMEREQVNWKKFYNINFPARLPENRNRENLFDASEWAPMPSGVLGPVTLTPVMKYEP